MVGLFLGVVLLCGVFFTLGYVMGRTQYGGSVHAEALPTRAVPASATDSATEPRAAPTVTPQDWDFSDHNKKKTDATGVPSAPPKPMVEVAEDSGFSIPSDTTFAAAPVATLKTRPAPSISMQKAAKGSIILQVAALRRQNDAISMANVLQKKHFPAFVDPARGDAFYRVQVGPYADERAADSARTALDHDGFKVIIKR